MNKINFKKKLLATASILTVANLMSGAAYGAVVNVAANANANTIANASDLDFTAAATIAVNAPAIYGSVIGGNNATFDINTANALSFTGLVGTAPAPVLLVTIGDAGGSLVLNAPSFITTVNYTAAGTEEIKSDFTGNVQFNGNDGKLKISNAGANPINIKGTIAATAVAGLVEFNSGTINVESVIGNGNAIKSIKIGTADATNVTFKGATNAFDIAVDKASTLTLAAATTVTQDIKLTGASILNVTATTSTRDLELKAKSIANLDFATTVTRDILLNDSTLKINKATTVANDLKVNAKSNVSVADTLTITNGSIFLDDSTLNINKATTVTNNDLKLDNKSTANVAEALTVNRDILLDDSKLNITAKTTEAAYLKLANGSGVTLSNSTLTLTKNIDLKSKSTLDVGAKGVFALTGEALVDGDGTKFNILADAALDKNIKLTTKGALIIAQGAKFTHTVGEISLNTDANLKVYGELINTKAVKFLGAGTIDLGKDAKMKGVDFNNNAGTLAVADGGIIDGAIDSGNGANANSKITFAGNGTVTGIIGATNEIAFLEVNGDNKSTVTLEANSTLTKIDFKTDGTLKVKAGKTLTVNANGAAANLNFSATGGTLLLADTALFAGNALTAKDKFGIVTFEGASNNTGLNTVLGANGNTLQQVNLQAAAAVVLDNVYTQELNFNDDANLKLLVTGSEVNKINVKTDNTGTLDLNGKGISLADVGSVEKKLQALSFTTATSKVELLDSTNKDSKTGNVWLTKVTSDGAGQGLFEFKGEKSVLHVTEDIGAVAGVGAGSIKGFTFVATAGREGAVYFTNAYVSDAALFTDAGQKLTLSGSKDYTSANAVADFGGATHASTLIVSGTTNLIAGADAFANAGKATVEFLGADHTVTSTKNSTVLKVNIDLADAKNVVTFKDFGFANIASSELKFLADGKVKFETANNGAMSANFDKITTSNNGTGTIQVAHDLKLDNAKIIGTKDLALDKIEFVANKTLSIIDDAVIFVKSVDTTAADTGKLSFAGKASISTEALGTKRFDQVEVGANGVLKTVTIFGKGLNTKTYNFAHDAIINFKDEVAPISFTNANAGNGTLVFEKTAKITSNMGSAVANLANASNLKSVTFKGANNTFTAAASTTELKINSNNVIFDADSSSKLYNDTTISGAALTSAITFGNKANVDLGVNTLKVGQAGSTVTLDNNKLNIGYDGTKNGKLDLNTSTLNNITGKITLEIDSKDYVKNNSALTAVITNIANVPATITDLKDKIIINEKGWVNYKATVNGTSIDLTSVTKTAEVALKDDVNLTEGEKDFIVKLEKAINATGATPTAADLAYIQAIQLSGNQGLEKGVYNVQGQKAADAAMGAAANTLDNRTSAMLLSVTPTASAAAGDEVLEKGAWLEVFGGSATQDLHKGENYTTKTFGFAAGFDAALNENHTAGIALSYGDTKLDNKGNNTAKSKVNTYMLTVYGVHDLGGGLGAVSNIFVANNKFEDNHARAIGGTAVSKYDALAFGGGVKLSSTYSMYNTLDVTPYAGINFSKYQPGSRTETGNTHNLKYTVENAAKRMDGSLGVRLSKVIESGETTIFPSIGVSVNHEMLGESTKMKMGVVSGTDIAQTISPAPRTVFKVDGTMRVKMSDQYDVTIGAACDFREKYVGYTGSLRLRVNL